MPLLASRADITRLDVDAIVNAANAGLRGGGGAGEPQLLADAYRASLARLREVGGRSIAFPAISTGAYGFPPELATPLAIATVREVLAAHGPLEVVFACYD